MENASFALATPPDGLDGVGRLRRHDHRAQNLGMAARIWWNSKSMARRDTSKRWCCAYTIRTAISGASISPTATAARWARPPIGGFNNGRGEFYDQESLNGRSILVRFVIADISANSCRFEQAFSDDGGKTWEVNWIAITRALKESLGRAQH